MTARQFAAWQAWLKMQWNAPDRHDFYVMKAMATYINSKLPKGSKLLSADDFKIELIEKAKIALNEVEANDPIQPVTKETIEAHNKQLMSGGTGMTIKTRRRSEVPYRDKQKDKK